MTSSKRHEILQNVRRSTLTRAARSTQAVQRRLKETQANIIPERGRPDNKVKQKTFVEEALSAGAHIDILADLDNVPASLTRYLQAHNQDGAVRIATDPLMAGIPWASEVFLKPQSGPALGGDTTGLALALAGIAETGTVLMASSPQSPAMINLLPISHCVLLPVSRIVGNYEQTIELIGNNMPRMATYITGPSRTADIEQKLLMGAHGPQRLLIMLIESL